MEELGYVNTIVYNTSFNYENEDSIYRAVELFIFIYLVGVTLCYTYILSSTFINNIVKWCFLSLWRRTQNRIKLVPDECSICLEDMVPDQFTKSMSCGHMFHEQCIDKWIEKSLSVACPNCRQVPNFLCCSFPKILINENNIML